MDSILTFSHRLLQEILQKGDQVIDATVGNGNDTVFLASLVGNGGHVYGFDIQEEAINNTREKLLLTGLSDSVSLHLDGHENLDRYISLDTPIAGAIFNLGFLPRGDKTIITQGETTIEALEKILNRLIVGGRVVLVIYSGHPGGQEEKDLVERFCTQLNQNTYQVLRYQFINQANNPPYILCIERRK